MNNKKEFNNYTREQIKRAFLHQVDLTDDLKTLPGFVEENTDRFNQWFENSELWSCWFLMPITELLSLLFTVTGYRDRIIEVLESSDPVESFLTMIDQENEENEENEGNEGNEENEIEFSEEEQGVIATMLFALNSHISAVRIYSKYMNEMIEDARHSDDSLFDAVLIDRTIMAIPSIAKRVQLAESKNDEGFFNHLSKSITKTRPRPKENIFDTKFILKLLDESGALNNVTQEELYEFVSRGLRAYEYKNGTKFEAFKKVIQTYKKVRGK